MLKRKFSLVFGLAITFLMLTSNVVQATCTDYSGAVTRNSGGTACGTVTGKTNYLYTCGSNKDWDNGKECASGTVCINDESKGTASCMKPTEGAGLANNPFNGCSTTSINTALGCIPVEMNAFIPWLLSWLFGVAGGIAFLLMAYGFILIATSAGDEKKVQGAKETITSAIIGLIVCIFAVFILKLIAVNILKIPGIN